MKKTMRIARTSFALVALSACLCFTATADNTLEETMDGIVTRLYAEMAQEELAALDNEAILDFITPEEREVLATKYWYFDVNVPVVVSVLRSVDQKIVPFWLPEAGFRKTDLTVNDSDDWATYEVWQKEFPAGRVELGINGFDKERAVYLVCVGPQDPDDEVKITDLFPADEAVIAMREGAWKYRDWNDLYLEDVPESLEGHKLLTSYRGRAREAHLIGAFRTTPFPSSKMPDQIILTWSEDPRTTQTVQWRTSTEVNTGVVRWKKKGAGEFTQTNATCEVIQDRLLMNDRYIHHYTAVLRDLEPATTYFYSVGSPDSGVWSERAEFTTAPDDPAPFSFIGFADTHYSPTYAKLLQSAFEQHPETAFSIIAGDVVSTGLYRNEWDHIAHYGRDIYNRRPLAFSLGNHDDQDGLGAWLPLALYEFPKNGPTGEVPESNFRFRYGNALFLFLTVGSPHEVQAEWMDKQLANSDATWKFVVFHFPIYSVDEDYAAIRKRWTPLFDTYGVDLAFHGHVHYYLRTKPMRELEPVSPPAEGTVYTISIAQNGRDYDLPEADWVEKRFTGTAVYPRITINGNRLVYRAYGMDGAVLDELIIEK